ncbi:MAG: DUF1080 domain-containing protein [Chloroflexi bacterium]|nr:DUF1080 domain-containing protein [Chloroflexota bacterium]
MNVEYGTDLRDWETCDPTAQLTTWHGRRCVKITQAGGYLLLKREPSLDSYRLAVDVAITGPDGYAGLIFAAQDPANYELVYVYPEKGAPGWIQYDPVMHGSNTWQIYHGPPCQTPAPVPAGEWVHLALDVYPDRVAVLLGDVVAPQLVVSLMHGRSRGRIGLWSYVPTNRGPAYLGQPAISLISAATPPVYASWTPSPTTITQWLVSSPEVLASVTTPPQPDATWQRVHVEKNGTMNLNRLFSPEGRAVVYAYAAVHATDTTKATISLGFSDRLRLWLNGRQIYGGEHCWDPPRSDGRIRLNQARVPVDLQAGQNTILAEVSELESAFGWGFILGVEAPGQELRFQTALP